MYSKLNNLYKKHRELISYVFFGGLTTLVAIAVHYVAYFMGAATELATTISWVCSVTFAFFVNKIFVFRSVSEKKADWLKQALSFYGARLATYFMELVFMILTVRVLGWSELTMKLVAQVFILVGNYLLSKFWIFRK